MSGRAAGTVTYAPVGSVNDNGYDLAGARFYPFSQSLAVTPPVVYGSYVGSGSGLPTTPPAAALSGTGGVNTANAHIAASPFGKSSPLPWVLGGLVLSLGAMYAVHYKK